MPHELRVRLHVGADDGLLFCLLFCLQKISTRMISQALHFAGSARGDERLSLKVLESLARQRDQDARDRCYDVLKALPSECFVIIHLVALHISLLVILVCPF